jgi:fumarate reductase subunit D
MRQLDIRTKKQARDSLTRGRLLLLIGSGSRVVEVDLATVAVLVLGWLVVLAWVAVDQRSTRVVSCMSQETLMI